MPMLSKSKETFVIKSPPIPFAVAVCRGNRSKPRFKIHGALPVNNFRGFGISFNSDAHVLFHAYFDLAYKQLYLCRNNGTDVETLEITGNEFIGLFKMKISLDTPFTIKIESGATFTAESVRSDIFNQCNMICVHGDIAIVKATLCRFVVASGVAPQSQLRPGGAPPGPPRPIPQPPIAPQISQVQTVTPVPRDYGSVSSSSSIQSIYPPYQPSHPTTPNEYQSPQPNAIPRSELYQHAIIEDKNGHNQRLIFQSPGEAL